MAGLDSCLPDRRFYTEMGAPENVRTYSIVSKFTIKMQVYQVCKSTRDTAKTHRNDLYI